VTLGEQPRYSNPSARGPNAARSLTVLGSIMPMTERETPLTAALHGGRCERRAGRASGCPDQAARRRSYGLAVGTPRLLNTETRTVAPVRQLSRIVARCSM